jgi:hypothetical protein
MGYPSLIWKQRGKGTFPFGPSVSAISLVQLYDASDTVCIGRSLRSFPASTPDMRLSPHPAFQYSSVDNALSWLALVSLGSGGYVYVFTYLTFPVSTPPSSYLPIFPGGPSSCPFHYRRAFGYYAAAALCPARWHFRVPIFGSSSCRVPQFHMGMF